MSYRDRLRSVSADERATPSQQRKSYYDDDLVSDQFKGQRRQERKERLLDNTQGYSYAETQPDGSIVGRDPKTKERRVLSPSEVNHAYLTGGAEPA